MYTNSLEFTMSPPVEDADTGHTMSAELTSQQNNTTAEENHMIQLQMHWRKSAVFKKSPVKLVRSDDRVWRKALLPSAGC